MGSVRARRVSAGAHARPLRYARAMPICRACGEEADEFVTVKLGGKNKKVCEDCADRAREEEEIAEASEAVVQGMMGFKGRR